MLNIRHTNKWLQTYLQKLKIRVPRNTGSLSKSIKGEIKATPDMVEMEFVALDYFTYQDEGVNGTQVNRGSQFSYRDKMPPTSAFKSYSNSLGGQFAIAKSIQQKGIAPKRFFKEELENDMKDLPTAILSDIWDSFLDKNEKRN